MKEQFKLTVEQERLYAGRRSSMPTMPIELLDAIEVKPRIAKEEGARIRIIESAEVRKESAARQNRRNLLSPERIEAIKKHAEKGEREGILSEVTGGYDLAINSLHSEKKVEQVFGVLSLELEAHTRVQPINAENGREGWTDNQRALEYEDWVDFSKELEKERKRMQKEGATVEEKSNMDDLTLATHSIRQELLKGASRDLQKTLLDDDKRTKFLEEPENFFVHAQQIDTLEIQKAFISLGERINTGKHASPEEIWELRKQWHDLEARFGAEVTKDSQDYLALEKGRRHISSLNKSISMVRREERQRPKPERIPHTEARAESSRREQPKQENEESRPQGGMASADHQILDRMRKDLFGKSDDEIRAHLEAAGMSTKGIEAALHKRGDDEVTGLQWAATGETIKWKDDEGVEHVERRKQWGGVDPLARLQEVAAMGEARAAATAQQKRERREKFEKNEAVTAAKKEAREAWKNLKNDEKRAKKLTGREGAFAQIDVDEDWSIYGWGNDAIESAQEKDKVRQRLKEMGLRRDKYEEADRILAALLVNGFTPEDVLNDLLKEGDDRPKHIVLNNFLEKFKNDEFVWEAFGHTEAYDAQRERRYSNEEVTDMENFGWNISVALEHTFGEDSENPAWERVVRKVDDKGRMLDYDGYYVNSEGKYVDKRGTLLSGGKKVKAEQIRFKVHEKANPDKAILWLRRQINWEHYKDEKGLWDAFNKVSLVGKKGFVHGELIKLLDDWERIFAGNKEERVPQQILEEVQNKDKHKDKVKIDDLTDRPVLEEYYDLKDMMEAEAYLVTMVRQMHITYEQNMTSDEELLKAMKNLLQQNHMTRDMWRGRPLFQYLATLAEDFTSMDKLDGKLGGTIVKNYMAYYYISDYKMLSEIVGKKRTDSSGREYYDTSDVPLYNINELRRIRNKQAESDGIDYNMYYNFAYAYKYDENGEVVSQTPGKTYVKDAEGNIKDGDRVVIAANGDIKDRDAAKKILGQVEKDGKTVWFDNAALNKIWEMKRDSSGDVIIETHEDDMGYKNMQPVTQIKKGAEKQFSNFINIFRAFDPDAKLEKIIKSAVSASGSEAGGHKLNDINEGYAGLLSSHLIRFTAAAARNDIPLVGKGEALQYDLIGRWINFRSSRAKYIQAKGEWNRSGRTGNPETIAEFKSILTEYMLGIPTTAKHKGPDGTWDKPILEVFHELNGAADLIDQARATGDKKKVDEATQQYRDVAKQLMFHRNAEVHYKDNQLERAAKIASYIVGGRQLDLDKFTGRTVEFGMWIKQKELQDELLGLFSAVRYRTKSGMTADYAMRQRLWDYDKEDWSTISLAEAQYGDQILNVPEFKDKNGKIDPKLIQNNLDVLWRRVLATVIVGELVHHRKVGKYEIGERKEMAWYRDVLDAVSKIPGDMDLSEGDMWGNKITKGFFPPKMLKQIKKESHTSFGFLIGLAILKSLFIGKPTKKDESVGAGLKEALGIIVKNSISMK